jgi:hypothetical protein
VTYPSTYPAAKRNSFSVTNKSPYFGIHHSTSLSSYDDSVSGELDLYKMSTCHI